MAKRSGLGQRGLDLLISGSPGASSKDTSEGKSASGKKTVKSASGKSKAASSGKNEKAKTTAKKTTASKKTETAAKKKTSTATKKKAASIKKTSTRVANANNDTLNINEVLGGDVLAATAETDLGTVDAAINEENDSKATSNEVVLTVSEKRTESAEEAPSDSGNNEPLMIPISKVEPNRAQPRKNFDEDALQELADSIRQFGVIQPLIVQKKDGYYEIIAGERRWRAARLASLKEVPVIVKEYTPKEVMEISLIENIQRQDLNPIEEASAYRRLMEEYELKQDEVAQRVSKSRAAIANSMRLLNLDSRVQDMVISEMLSTGHARALLAITDPDIQFSTAQKVFDEKLTVRDVEKLVRKLNQAPSSPVKKQISDALQAIYMDLSEKMKASLGTKVSIAPRSAQKGKIEIEYYSQDELDRLCSLLNGIGQREEV